MKFTHHKGFTLIELMIVITIVGILAAIALPNFISYRKRSYNTNALQDAKNTYTASQSYFNDNPTSSLLDIVPLYSYGFKQTGNVTILISGTQSSLEIMTYHSAGNKTYTIGSEGRVD